VDIPKNGGATCPPVDSIAKIVVPESLEVSTVVVAASTQLQFRNK